MKHVLLLIVTAIGFAIARPAVAQTLKVSSVDASDDKVFHNEAGQYLGHNLILDVYDNSVTVKIDKHTEVLKLIADDAYKATEENDTETYIYTLTIHKTVGVTTSADFEMRIQENKGQRRVAWLKLIAKRF
ncbi:MAG TPA: hypothetical protein VG367_19485 [Mucilaginibacter sp.]|jgi:hypothetical protein|nr:hypothetical protein [Mucilaginibacter sp.]